MDILAEMEQEPFNANEFLERLAWSSMGVSATSEEDSFSETRLLDSFEETISHLQVLRVRAQQKCEKLESICREEEVKHWENIAKLEEKNKAAVQAFHELDSRINSVATKVVYLGDQLENVNTPRSRAVEAQKNFDTFQRVLKTWRAAISSIHG